MRILIDIGHPGHVHLFRHFAVEMQKKGHEFLFTTRQKEFEIELLSAFGFRYVSFGKHYSTLRGKLWGIARFDLMLLKTAMNFRPHLFMSHGSIYAAHVAALMGKPHISMEDSGNMEQIRLYRPFTKAILTPEVLPEKLGPKQIRYNGYHEIAYLHPKYFTPDPAVRDWLGLSPDEKFCIVRFVSWKATHDLGQKGFSADEKTELIRLLSSRYRVFISAEATLPEELKGFQIRLSPQLIHHALAFADLVLSEGATIASEAGVLGTPSIYVNSISRSYNEDQEKYGTVFNFRSGKGVAEKLKEVMNDDQELYRQRSRHLIEDKIDVTGFLVWFVENYPSSFEQMKQDHTIQYQFR